jgi:hypothetical protein
MQENVQMNSSKYVPNAWSNAKKQHHEEVEMSFDSSSLMEESLVVAGRF